MTPPTGEKAVVKNPLKKIIYDSSNGIITRLEGLSILPEEICKAVLLVSAAIRVVVLELSTML